jgi:hypothetical protein
MHQFVQIKCILSTGKTHQLEELNYPLFELRDNTISQEAGQPVCSTLEVCTGDDMADSRKRISECKLGNKLRRVIFT